MNPFAISVSKLFDGCDIGSSITSGAVTRFGTCIGASSFYVNCVRICKAMTKLSDCLNFEMITSGTVSALNAIGNTSGSLGLNPFAISVSKLFDGCDIGSSITSGAVTRFGTCIGASSFYVNCVRICKAMTKLSDCLNFEMITSGTVSALNAIGNTSGSLGLYPFTHAMIDFISNIASISVITVFTSMFCVAVS